MWPVTFRESGKANSPAPPKPPPGPDYSALVDALLDLGKIPDWAGETILDSREAARIRSCGFTARKGLWRCPAIPPEFLLPGLWHLASDLDHLTRPIVWHAKRAEFRQISPIDPLSKREHQLIRLIRKAPDGRLTRRQLQQRVSRRIWTRLSIICSNTLTRRTTSQLHTSQLHRRLDLSVRPRGVRIPRTTSPRAAPSYAALCTLTLRIRLLIADRPTARSGDARVPPPYAAVCKST